MCVCLYLLLQQLDPLPVNSRMSAVILVIKADSETSEVIVLGKLSKERPSWFYEQLPI